MDEHFLDAGSMEGGNLYKPEEDSSPEADEGADSAKPFGADLVYADDGAAGYYELIHSYAEKGPTAFYSPEEFETAYRTLREICMLRAASIRLQLDGELSTDTDLQSEAARVDASRLSVKAMGVIEE